MKKFVSYLLLGASLVSVTACTTVIREPVHARAPVVTIREIPAPIVETIPPPPTINHHWVAGHWVWRDGDWRWAPGHYYASFVKPMPALIVEEITVAPSPAHFWVRGHWVWRNNEWEWAKGHWSR